VARGSLASILVRDQFKAHFSTSYLPFYSLPTEPNLSAGKEQQTAPLLAVSFKRPPGVSMRNGNEVFTYCQVYHPNILHSTLLCMCPGRKVIISLYDIN